MTNIEEKAYIRMVSIFDSLVHEEKLHFHGYFAGDLVKVNKKSFISPVFVGFSRSALTLVSLSRELEKEQVIHIPSAQLKGIRMKKRFLSKIHMLSIECTDSTSYMVGVPHTLSYLPVQRENVDLFLASDFLLRT